MIKAKTMIMLMAVLLSACIATSCSDDTDGLWEEMKWKCDGKKLKGRNLQFGADGGEKHVVCTNYVGFWFAWLGSLEEAGALDSEDPLKIKGEWYAAKAVGNELIVTIDPLPEGVDNRLTHFTVTAGDIFCTWHLEQNR